MPGFEDRNGHYPKIVELPDGSVEVPPGYVQLNEDVIRYNASGGHFYLHLPTLDWMKGFTTILKNARMDEGLIRYIANQGGYDQYKENLAGHGRMGTRIHERIAALFAGKTIHRKHSTPDEWPHLVSIVQMARDHEMVTFGIEHVITDVRRKIATQIDWIGLIDGVPSSVNWKKSAAIYDTALVQANEEAVVHNQNPIKELGPVEQYGVGRTATRHKAGYELALEKVGDKVSQQRHAYFNHLHAIEQYHDPKWMPIFQKPLPDSLSIAPATTQTNRLAFPENHAPKNGRP